MCNRMRPPLLFGCTPLDGESLVGFILRLTEANRLSTPNQLLEYIGGRISRPPTPSDVPQLAYLCNCDPNLIARLFGFESRTERREVAWRFGTETITKPYFISSRTLAYCPTCISSEPFLRAEWELTLNTCCPLHGVHLEHQCPHCGRDTRWMRPGVTICHCGGLLTASTPRPATEFPLFISRLVRSVVDTQYAPSTCESIPYEISQKLSRLSLDALFKTLWFLGDVLPSLPRTRTRSSSPLKCTDANQVLSRACAVLSDWPAKFFGELEYATRRPVTDNSASLIRNVYGPIHRYLSEDMDSDEFRFVRLAYEHHVKKLWAAARKVHPKTLSPQLDLPLEE